MRFSWTSCGFMLALLAVALPATASDAALPAPMQVHADMLDGGRYSLAGSRGTIALLVIWSPDSLASRKSMGELERFAGAYRDRGVGSIAVSTLRDAEALRQFAARRNLTVPLAMLGENDLGPLPEQRLPVVYVFDRDGSFRGMHAGLFSYRTLERLVEPLMR